MIQPSLILKVIISRWSKHFEIAWEVRITDPQAESCVGWNTILDHWLNSFHPFIITLSLDSNSHHHEAYDDENEHMDEKQPNTAPANSNDNEPMPRDNTTRAGMGRCLSIFLTRYEKVPGHVILPAHCSLHDVPLNVQHGDSHGCHHHTTLPGATNNQCGTKHRLKWTSTLFEAWVSFYLCFISYFITTNIFRFWLSYNNETTHMRQLQPHRWWRGTTQGTAQRANGHENNNGFFFVYLY